jgi:glycosyltransferase involved in cell wall biosynthesis
LTETKDVQEKQTGPVVTIARLVDRKNVETVIKAWKLLPAEVQADRELIIVGEGENRTRLEELTSSESDIRFTGWESEQRKVELLERASVFVLPALRDGYDVEGFGIVYIEAQAAGTPVIGSSYGGVPEAVGDGGVIVDQPEDPAVISNEIERLVSDQDEYKTYQERINRRISKYSNENIVSKYISTYEKSCNRIPEEQQPSPSQKSPDKQE